LHHRASTVDYIQRQKAIEKKEATLVYIYFHYKTRHTQTAVEVIRNIYKQLLVQSATIPAEVESLYDHAMKTGATPDRGRFVELIEDFQQKLNLPIYSIFDAFDECDVTEQKDILDLFYRLKELHFRLLISSRQHCVQMLKERLSDSQLTAVSARDSDVQNYVNARLETESNIDPILKAKCLDLVKAARGMYILQG
jgi:hypothetical protein